MDHTAAAPTARRRPWRAALGLVRTAAPAALVLAGLVAGALVVARPPGDRDRRDLSPLAPGTTSVFRTSADGRPSGRDVSVVTGPTLLVSAAGRPTASVVESRYDHYRGGRPLDALGYVGWRGDELLSYGVRFDGRFFPTTPPQPTAKVGLAPGRRWRWRGTLGDAEARSTSTFVGYEPVRALGRTLTGCSHYRTATVSTVSGRRSSGVDDAWLCRGVGLVRLREVSQGHVWEEELVRFSSPARTLGPPAGGPGTAAAAGAADAGRSHAVAAAGAPAERPAWTLDLQHRSRVAGDARVTVTADAEGTIASIARRNGQVLWRVTVPPPLAAPPVVAGPVVLVADAEKHLQAFDAATGAVRWAANFPDVLASAPAVRRGIVVAVGHDKVVRALRLADGAPLWTASLRSLAEAPPAIAGATVVVGEQEGTLKALELETGEDRWERSLDGLLGVGPAFGGGLVVAADEGGAVYGIDGATGALRWNRYLGGRVELAPAVAARRVVVAVGERRLVALSPADGRTVWSRTLARALASGPLLLGGHVLVADEEGSLTQLALADGGDERELELPRPHRGGRATGALAYFGGTLVATLDFDDVYFGTLAVALPAGEGGGVPPDDGVVFRRVSQTRLPPVPLEPPVLDGDRLVFPAFGGKLWSVRPGGAARVLASVKLSFFAVPDGDLLLTQQETSLVAIPRDGGPPRWRFPIGSASPAAVPALSGRLAVVAAGGLGLVALDRATGRPRWFFRDAGPSVSPPLALPQGDVVWAAPDGLVRVDARTGRRVWTLPGVDAFAPLATGDGLILVDGAYRGVERIVAVSSRTGRVRWQTAPLPAASFVGPAAGGGVVVAAGGDTVVRAFALGTGRPLWSTPLRSAPDGPLAILGDRVVVAEKGREEDLDRQTHTITAHDLRSGRLLGLLQLPGAGSGYPLTGSFRALGRGRLVEYGASYLYTFAVEG